MDETQEEYVKQHSLMAVTEILKRTKNIWECDDFYAEMMKELDIEQKGDNISIMLDACQVLFPQSSESAVQLREDMDRIAKELMASALQKFRVGSLCSDYSNCLMWSHYADCHKGFCIEYDFSTVCKELENVCVLPVVYSEKRPLFPWDVVFARDKESETVKRRIAHFMEYRGRGSDVLCRYAR